MSTLAVGSFVVHRTMPQLGIGKVFCAGYQYALVGFIDDHGRKEVRRLPNDFVIPAPDLGHSGFDSWNVEATGDCREVPKTLAGKIAKGRAVVPKKVVAEWTLEQAYERFLTHYPDGMRGERYQHCERSWKWQQHELWHEQLSGGRLRDLAASDPHAAGEAVMRVVQTKRVPLLARKGEIPMLNWALREGTPAPFLHALADVVESAEPAEGQFEALAGALESIPTREPGTKLRTWPIVTVVPFLVRPESHMFLKPKPTKIAAKKLGVDLYYDARPTWAVYKRLIDWSRELLEFLEPRGAKDMIDVQSFLWTLVAADVEGKAE